jgi:hypothetical protein
MTEQHEMVLEEKNALGEENWYCPTCGRRMIITWNPWKKVVLEQGDLYAAHGGSKGGFSLGHIQITQGDQVIGPYALGPSADDPALAPWQRWLDGVDSDNLWNREL